MASNFLKLHLQISKNQTPLTPKFSFPYLFHQPKCSPQTKATLSTNTCIPCFLSYTSIFKRRSNSPSQNIPFHLFREASQQPPASRQAQEAKTTRFQVEIPLIEDSPSSLPQLALDIFKDMSLTRKGSLVEILVLWPDVRSKEAGIQAFQSCSLSHIQHIDLPSVSKNNRISSPSEVAVFLAPDSPQLGIIKAIADSMYPKPLVIFNPKWGFEEESGFGDLKGFVGSFEVIYSFMGLEVKGILSKRKGMVFKCVRDGVLSGEQWSVLVEEEGEMKVVSRFKSRPAIEEVENVLYNLMGINSPITKSAKFLRDLVSNVTGKKYALVEIFQV